MILFDSTELSHQMSVTEVMHSDCAKILSALLAGIRVDKVWAKHNDVDNHTTRISDLRRGLHDEHFWDNINQRRKPGKRYNEYWINNANHS